MIPPDPEVCSVAIRAVGVEEKFRERAKGDLGSRATALALWKKFQ